MIDLFNLLNVNIPAVIAMEHNQGWAGKTFYPPFSNNGMGKPR